MYLNRYKHVTAGRTDEKQPNKKKTKQLIINHLVFFSTRTRDIDMKTHENE